MTGELMMDFSVGGGVVGTMSAAYLYPYALFQIPLGMLLDGWGTRRTFTMMAGLCAAGCAIFAAASTIYWAYLGRVVVGIASGVGLIGSLSIATRRLHPARFPLVSGATLTASMVGAVLGQAPLARLVEGVGWRITMLMSAVAALGFAILLWMLIGEDLVYSPPKQWRDRSRAMSSEIKEVVGASRTWVVSLYGAGMGIPLFAFAMLWGVPFLSTAYDIPPSVASLGTIIMLLGWAISSPISGWWAGRSARYRLTHDSWSYSQRVGTWIRNLRPSKGVYCRVFHTVSRGARGRIDDAHLRSGEEVSPKRTVRSGVRRREHARSGSWSREPASYRHSSRSSVGRYLDTRSACLRDRRISHCITVGPGWCSDRRRCIPYSA